MKKLTRENKSVVGYVIIGFCLVVFCALIVSAFALKEEPYNPETFCQDEVRAHTIVVLDKTDFLSIGQQRFIINWINEEKDCLDRFEKFSVFTLTEDTYLNPESIFSKCSPGVGKNANQLYQNPKKIQRRFDESFSRPLKENMKNALIENSGSRSAILEMIKELSLRDDFGNDVEKKSLVIVSDMMHHMPKYSHYKGKIGYGSFSMTPYAYEVAARLNSVDVRIVYLLRENLGHIQGERHLLFWKNYFEDMGASVGEVRRVL